jgi:hypothetical protein
MQRHERISSVDKSDFGAEEGDAIVETRHFPGCLKAVTETSTSLNSKLSVISWIEKHTILADTVIRAPVKNVI